MAFSTSSSFNKKTQFYFLGCSAMVLMAMLTLLGCSSSKKLSQEASCQEKWEKAKTKFAKKKYTDAKEPLSDLISACPGSNFTEEALFDLAEAHFNLEEWIEAESEYGAFLKDFPASKKYAELARWRLAAVAANQVEPPNRDQTKTLEAIQGYETFLDEYPDSPYADTAKTQLDKLKDQLVTKKMQIARLYTRMDEPQAAAIYYKSMLKEFGTRVNQRDINLKLAECYIKMLQFEEADAFLAKFDGIAKDDPFLGKVKQAFNDLAKARAKVDRQKKEEQDLSKRQEPM
jgi:outer membrane protein assembly factor BamD